MRRTFIAFLAPVLCAAGLVGSSAGGAAASVKPNVTCPTHNGSGSQWGHIAANPSANERCSASTSGTIAGQAYYGDLVRVICYTKSATNNTGWGGTNPYWDYLYDYDEESQGVYVADVWVNTGGDITTQVPLCS